MCNRVVQKDRGVVKPTQPLKVLMKGPSGCFDMEIEGIFGGQARSESKNFWIKREGAEEVIVPDVEQFGEKDKTTGEQHWEDVPPGTARGGQQGDSTSNPPLTMIHIRPSQTRIAATLALALACALVSAQAQTLSSAGSREHLLIGTAVDTNLLSDSAYSGTLGREYSQLEPEGDLKWKVVHPSRNSYNFSPADRLWSFANSHSMKMRGHTLVWYHTLPGWLTSGKFTAAELSTLLQDHISTVMGHYKGELYAWDVVNEAFNNNGTIRPSVWYNSPGIGFSGQGTKYIEQAFQWAHAADPDCLLFYNDYDAEVVNAKSNAVYNMVKDFKSRGVPIDGVGLQMHIGLRGLDLASLDANVKRLTGLGLQVQITEMDVKLPVPSNGNATGADLQAQANVYRNVLKVCIRYPKFTAFQTWGFTDAHSWIPSFSPGYGAALPFDRQYNQKPAYWQIVDLLRNQAGVRQ